MASRAVREAERQAVSQEYAGPPPSAAAPTFPAPSGSSVPSKPASGVLAWALGFVVFAPIPFLGALASGIAMAIPYRSLARQGELARENARVALNWGVTFAIVSTLLLVTHFVLLVNLARDGGVADFYPLGIPITAYGALVLCHIVLVIVGTIRAANGKRMVVPFAIPFAQR